jgi:hypothetical protein
VNPDIGSRLHAMSMALRQVVIPALPPDEVLAIEQATVCVGHLAVLGEQYNYLADYELLCLTEMATLGQQLAETARGGPETSAAADHLRTVLRDAGPARDGPAHTRCRRRNQIAAAIDELILAGLVDAEPDFLVGSQELVLAHGKHQARRDRAWFQHTGLDPDSAELPGIPDLIDAAVTS